MSQRGYITDVYEDKIKAGEIQYLMIISSVGILVLALYSYINLTRGDTTAGIVELGLGMSLLISLINLIFTSKTQLTRATGAIVLMALVISNTFTGGFSEHGLYWSYIFPCMIFLLVGSRNGIYVSLILFSILATILTLQGVGYFLTPYNSTELASHYASMGLITLLIYVYQKMNERSQTLTREINRRLVTTNKELTKQADQYDDAQKQLFEFTRSIDRQGSDIENLQEEIFELRKKIDVSDKKTAKKKATKKKKTTTRKKKK